MNFFFLATIPTTMAYSILPSENRSILPSSCSVFSRGKPVIHRDTSLRLEVDQNVLIGGGIALATFVGGIGVAAFTESQGERAKERGGGVSDNMATNLVGKFMEDYEVSTVDDVGGLASQLENALIQSGGLDKNKVSELELTDEEKKKVAEDLDDGW